MINHNKELIYPYLSYSHVVGKIFWVWKPVGIFYLTRYELDIMWALSIIILCAIFGPRVIVPQSPSSILIHIVEVHVTIHSSLELRYISVNFQFPFLRVEHLLLFLSVHYIEARSNVDTIIMLGV